MQANEDEGGFLMQPSCHIDEQEDSIAQEDNFTLLPSTRPEQDSTPPRQIKRSVVNRSCINTCSHSNRSLSLIPDCLRLGHPHKLSALQRLDLSGNNLACLDQLAFQELTSLKELILRDNQVRDLPFQRLNLCRGLRLLDATSNQLTLIPPLLTVAYLQARGNPLRLVTARLLELPLLEFLSCDWLDYLVESEGGDSWRSCSRDYTRFREHILEKVDYSLEGNSSYCDFHCYFGVRLASLPQEDRDGLMSRLLARAVLQHDSFFVNYLRHLHNQLNYAQLTHNSRLLLELVLESGRPDALELFTLCKNNYAQAVSEPLFLLSVQLACRHPNYDFFRFLIGIRARRQALRNPQHLAPLINETLARFSLDRGSDRILIDLMRLHQQGVGEPFKILLPANYSQRQFRHMAAGVLLLRKKQPSSYQLQAEEGTTPMHFATRSRNDQLVAEFIRDGQDVLACNALGSRCKYVPNATLASRKMIWRREKQLLAQHFANNPTPTFSHTPLPPSTTQPLPSQISARNPYPDLSTLSYRKPSQLLQLSRTPSHTPTEELLDQLRSKLEESSQLSWQNHYRKKKITNDTLLFLLQRIARPQQPQLFRRMDSNARTAQELARLADRQIEDLVGWEMAETQEWLGRVGEVEVETGRGGVARFWCCQNAVCE